MSYIVNSPLFGEIALCYPRNGLVFPDYSHQNTLQSLNLVLPSFLTVGRDRKFKMLCPDGRMHEFGLYTQGGRYLINTFGKYPGLFGKDAPYSCDTIGVTLASRGLAQTKDNVLSVLGISKDRGAAIEEESALDITNLEVFDAEKDEAMRDEARERNREEIRSAIRDGRAVFPDIKDGILASIPKNLAEALSMRGIDAYELPPSTLEDIGFCERIEPVRTDGQKYRSKTMGVLFRLDDGNWQIRCMRERISPADGTRERVYTSKGSRDLRFVTMGSASPLGLKWALVSTISPEARPLRPTPLVVFEGAFDKLSMDMLSKGRISTASLQGCGNASYIAEHAALIAKRGIPVSIAFDGDRAGEKGVSKLDAELRRAGCKVVKWPGFLSKDDMNDLVMADKAEAKALTDAMGLILEAVSASSLSADIVSRITGAACPDGLSQESLADRISMDIRGRCEIGGMATYRKRLEEALEGRRQGQATERQEPARKTALML